MCARESRALVASGGATRRGPHGRTGTRRLTRVPLPRVSDLTLYGRVRAYNLITQETHNTPFPPQNIETKMGASASPLARCLAAAHLATYPTDDDTLCAVPSSVMVSRSTEPNRPPNWRTSVRQDQ